MNTSASNAHLLWEQRLQDWLDDELPASQAPLLQDHLAGCAACRDQLQHWQRLDAQLQAALPPLALDANFDARLFARIDAIDDQERNRLKARLEQEHDQQRAALGRTWRRSLALLAPGMLGGIALALSLASWMDDSGATRALVAQGAAELGPGNAQWLNSTLMAVLGAAVGGMVAPWLARLAD